jgi:surface antigen
MANGLLIPTANKPAAMAAQQGTHNNFGGIYSNQCTFWAAERYHELTGIWVPWLGNANQWAVGAQNAGWNVSTTPTVPSIICLQGYAGQGVLSNLGHVGLVESINSNGSVHTSNFNWSPHMGDSQVVYVDFWAGPGVTFLSFPGASSSGGGLLTALQNGSLTAWLAQGAKNVSIAPNADVTQFLFSMDDALQFVNPFTPPDVQQDHVLGVTFNDPIDYLEKVAGALWQDSVAITWRIIFLLLGFFLLYKVLSHFVDFAGIAQQAGGIASMALKAGVV